MADKRKLQSDIERNLKKVQEGRTAFKEILERFESSVNQTQKEKFENDLKKEIKKLQRLREQIKTWLTASEVKDKRPLLDARKEIEQDMERFKIIEKETKTKAYSKEGLLSTDAKKDPMQKEKEELGDWLKQCISSLNTQTEKYEFEIESLTNSSKKKRNDITIAIEEKRQRLEMCCFHVEKLETIMRLLDNERLDCGKVRSIQEPIEYVVGCGDDPSILDYRSMYDDLRLDEISDSTVIGSAPGNVVNPSEHDVNGIPAPPASIPNHRLGNDDAGSSTSTHTTASNHTDSSLTHPSSSTSSNASSSRERAKSDEKANSMTHVSASSTSTPLKPSTGAVALSTSKHKSANIANQTAPPALMSQVVAGTPNKSLNRSFAAHATNGASHISSTDSTSSKGRAHNADSQSSADTSRAQKGENNAKVSDRLLPTSSTQPHVSCESQHTPSRVSSISDQNSDFVLPTTSSGSPNPAGNSTASSLAASTPSATYSVVIKTGFAGSLASAGNPSGVSTNTSISAAVSSAPLASTCVSQMVQPKLLSTDSISTSLSGAPSTTLSPIGHVHSNLLSSSSLALVQENTLPGLLSNPQSNPSLISEGQLPPGLDASLSTSLSGKFQSVAAATGQVLPLSSVIPSGPSQNQQSHLPMEKQLTALQAPLHAPSPRMASYTHMHPRDAAAPFRNRNLDKAKGPVPHELLLQLQALESGYRRLPHPCDTEKSRMIVCKNFVNGPSYYPREPLPGTDTEDYYMKLDAQTLFFIFYYFEGTKAQYFAAKALKRMSWRFHTKFMMWFQRHEEPKQITDEYESGSYIYYDFKTMSQRKKEEFMFHYSFLEDKDF
ncbi:unnamed protein product [Calicophoron daubneyi]|uniref:CCR4-NOT transcription complex subunit 3 n=1 Tax=Calicophoron daubneyi TaxID=300641 RepID=A0AAV2T281_CALDB